MGRSSKPRDRNPEPKAPSFDEAKVCLKCSLGKCHPDSKDCPFNVKMRTDPEFKNKIKKERPGNWK